MDGDKIGIINEIGDLGLGFSEISEKDQKILSENTKKELEKEKDKKDK